MDLGINTKHLYRRTRPLTPTHRAQPGNMEIPTLIPDKLLLDNQIINAMKTEWVRNDNAKPDIWLNEAEIEPTKWLISKFYFAEFWMLFGDLETSKEEKEKILEEYIANRIKSITFDDVLSFSAGMFGNKIERTVSIMRDGEVIERWQRKIINNQKPINNE